MFRIVNFSEENPSGAELFRYISVSASRTVYDGLDFLFDGEVNQKEMYRRYYQYWFFEGFGAYVGMDDEEAGQEVLARKAANMKRKMRSEEYYTFDILEERIFADSIKEMKRRSSAEKGFKDRFIRQKEEEKAFTELREKYKLAKREATDISRKMFRMSCMGLKVNEPDNLFFWDDDHEWFFKDGFLDGVQRLKSMEGEMAGYGYDYTCGIFSEIGLKPPILLLGTAEANRIANEEAMRIHSEKMDQFLAEMLKELD